MIAVGVIIFSFLWLLGVAFEVFAGLNSSSLERVIGVRAFAGLDWVEIVDGVMLAFLWLLGVAIGAGLDFCALKIGLDSFALFGVVIAVGVIIFAFLWLFSIAIGVFAGLDSFALFGAVIRVSASLDFFALVGETIVGARIFAFIEGGVFATLLGEMIAFAGVVFAVLFGGIAAGLTFEVFGLTISGGGEASTSTDLGARPRFLGVVATRGSTFRRVVLDSATTAVGFWRVGLILASVEVSVFSWVEFLDTGEISGSDTSVFLRVSFRGTMTFCSSVGTLRLRVRDACIVDASASLEA